jgi:hypothetical protein
MHTVRTPLWRAPMRLEDVMRRRMLLMGVVTALVAVHAAVAQEGHPLVGSWHGNWGFDAATRRDLTVVIDYTSDGAGLTGLANPGYDHAALQRLEVTIPAPADWKVSFAVDLKDKSGTTTRYMAQGTLAKIGSDRRTLTGTWTAGTQKGDFALTRDRDYSR